MNAGCPGLEPSGTKRVFANASVRRETPPVLARPGNLCQPDDAASLVVTEFRVRMGWIERRPRDVTSQILEYAESGRLVDGPPTSGDQTASIAIVVIAAIVLGAGLSLAATGSLGPDGQIVTIVALMVVIGALAVLVPAIRLLRVVPTDTPVKIRPAAVLPPELVQEGNWIHRDGAWVRVEHVGRNGGGRVHALLSSGEVAELTTPTTIAGDEFRPHRDPVASLRH